MTRDNPVHVAPEDVPKEMNCLRCRAKRPVDVTMEVTDQTYRSGKTSTRYVWKGTCRVCNKQVRQYAKSPLSVPKEPNHAAQSLDGIPSGVCLGVRQMSPTEQPAL